MTWLIGEILVFLIAAAVIGLIVGWLLGRIRRRKTLEKKVEERLASHSAEQADDDEVASAEQQLDELRGEIAERDATIERLQAELAPHRTDDLKLIHGIGPVFERSLNTMGYTTYEQVAAWSQEDVRKVAAEIDLFPDRIVRDEWIEQAAALALRKANPVTPPSISFDEADPAGEAAEFAAGLDPGVDAGLDDISDVDDIPDLDDTADAAAEAIEGHIDADPDDEAGRSDVT